MLTLRYVDHGIGRSPPKTHWTVFDKVNLIDVLPGSWWWRDAQFFAVLLNRLWPSAAVHGRCPIEYQEPCWVIERVDNGRPMDHQDIVALVTCSMCLTREADCPLRGVT